MSQHQQVDLNRIDVDPAVLAGKPVSRGTRIPVSLILNYLEHRHTADDIIADYPVLTEEDIVEAIAFAEWEQQRTEARDR